MNTTRKRDLAFRKVRTARFITKQVEWTGQDVAVLKWWQRLTPRGRRLIRKHAERDQYLEVAIRLIEQAQELLDESGVA